MSEEMNCNHNFFLRLGSQSNPFQNLDKSAVLQEVRRILRFLHQIHIYFSLVFIILKQLYVLKVCLAFSRPEHSMRLRLIRGNVFIS